MTGPLVVTGGLGLIGGALVNAWEHEAGVVVVDDGRAACWSAGEMRRDRDPAQWVKTDVATFARMFPSTGMRPHAIVHCAAPVGPVGILSERVLERLVDDARAVCDMAARSEAPLLMLSSSEVHGQYAPGDDLRLPAEWSPRAEYALGKVACEHIAARHRHETGLPTAVVRPWNVTGPRQRAQAGFVLPRWIDAARAGDPIEVYGDGLQQRAFMFVDDLAQLMAALLVGAIAPAGAWDARPLEAASPANATTLLRLAHMVHVAVGVPGVKVTRQVDPRELHGPLFREAHSGSKVPLPAVDLEGWTGLARIVARCASERPR